MESMCSFKLPLVQAPLTLTFNNKRVHSIVAVEKLNFESLGRSLIYLFQNMQDTKIIKAIFI